MAIVRVEKNKNYTCMSNYHLRDTRLSNKAVGLMSKMLSLPDNWDYSIQGLTAICKDGKDSIISQLKELEATGYLIRQKSKNDKGQFKKIEYTLYEKPVTENPNMGNPNSENPTQLNTNKLNTKELNTYIGGKAPKQPKSSFIPPTKADIQAYILEKIESGKNEYRNVDVDTFYEYYNEAGWHMSNGRKIKNWKQCLVTWASREWNRKKAVVPEPPRRKIVYADELREANE